MVESSSCVALSIGLAQARSLPRRRRSHLPLKTDTLLFFTQHHDTRHPRRIGQHGDFTGVQESNIDRARLR
jgi:hypothetical protein